LISPRLGDAKLLQLPVTANTDEVAAVGHIVALPLGGRIKMNPWDDSLELLKSTTVGTIANRDKMSFEITPFMIYLTRVDSQNPKTSDLIAPLRPGPQTATP
jgi:hypothetical protein